MSATAEREALNVIRRLGVVRMAEIEAHGIPRGRVYQLLRKRQVTRHARGVYTASNHDYTAQHTLAHVAKRVPSGVFCLLTSTS